MSVDRSFDLLAQAKEVQRSYHLEAERDKQAREAGKARKKDRPSFKYQLGRHLLNLGKKLSQENDPA